MFQSLTVFQSSEIIKLCQECIAHAHLLDKHHSALIKALLQGIIMNTTDILSTEKHNA